MALPTTITQPLRRSPQTLRLSVTDRCNFRCRYCRPVPLRGKLPRADLPSLETLTETVRWLRSLFDIRKIKITGGEPLVRSSLPDLIKELALLPGVDDLSLTTNGSRLAEVATTLRAAGLRRLNISLDTLRAERFSDLTGGNLENTLRGISAALSAGFDPVKINAVLHRSTWQEDVPRLLDYALERGCELRLIELMRAGAAADWAQQEYVAAPQVRDWINDHAFVNPLPPIKAETARRDQIIWRGGEIVLGWITPQSDRFCGGCDRLRLDARGHLRRCLMDPVSFPLIESLQWRSDNVVREQVLEYVSGKKPPADMSTPDPMVNIGG